MSLLRRLPFVLGGAPLFVMAACAMTGESTSDSRASLTGTLAGARACAIEDAYTATPLGGFTSLTHDQLPGALQAVVPAHVAAVARFDAAHAGTVYVIQDFDDSTTFYDAGAIVLARRDAGGLWSLASGTALDCSPDLPPPVQVDGGPAPQPEPGRDASAPFCDPSDVLEVEPNDVTPEPLAVGDWVCASVGGSDVDTFAVEIPPNAAGWALGWETDPDVSTKPPFVVSVDGVVTSSSNLRRADKGKHIVQVSSGTGTTIAYRMTAVLAQRD